MLENCIDCAVVLVLIVEFHSIASLVPARLVAVCIQCGHRVKDFFFSCFDANRFSRRHNCHFNVLLAYTFVVNKFSASSLPQCHDVQRRIDNCTNFRFECGSVLARC